MKFGAHVSIAGGIDQAPARAHQLGCECFQIFSRSPRGGQASKLTQEIVKKFKSECQKYNFKEYYIHTPYFINLGSSNNRIYYGSISAVREELERGSLLSAQYVMTHLGSAKDLGLSKTLRQTIEGIGKILDGYRGKARLLLEIAAGAGKIIGDSFEDVAYILKNVPKNIGVCFDTAHAFASG